MQGQRFTSFAPRADLPRLQAALTTSTPAVEGGSWYDIQNATQAEAEVFIYGPIGDFGVSADDFVRDFAGIRASRVTVRVNSEGGNVFDGFAIYNALARHPAEVTAVVEGLAASAASFIIMGANRVVMAKRSQLMMHKASAISLGNADDMAKMAEVLNKFDDEIASVYRDKAGGTVAEWRDRMKAETWLTAEEALSLNLADEVLGQKPEDRIHVSAEAPAASPPLPVADSIEPTPEDAPIDWDAVFERAVDAVESDELMVLAEGTE